LLGCSDEQWKADTYPAHGTLTVNGEPAVGAVVELHSVGGQPDVRNSRPWAIVQEDGSYVLSTYESGDGAPVGDYAVTLRWPPDVGQPSLADRFDGAYATRSRSQWEVSISEGENPLPPITLEGVRLNAQPAPRRKPGRSLPPMGGATAQR
jgi:hypothetical protein